MTPAPVTVIEAPRRPETWMARAGEILGDLLLAMLIVTGVPLAFILVTTAVIWLVRAMVAIVGGV